MKLYDILKLSEDEEFTVWDVDYEMETYFYSPGTTTSDDPYFKAMEELTQLVDVVKISSDGITVNFYGLIENKIDKLNRSGLFRCDVDVDDVMEDIENYISGFTSGEWFAKFVDALKED